MFSYSAHIFHRLLISIYDINIYISVIVSVIYSIASVQNKITKRRSDPDESFIISAKVLMSRFLLSQRNHLSHQIKDKRRKRGGGVILSRDLGRGVIWAPFITPFALERNLIPLSSFFVAVVCYLIYKRIKNTFTLMEIMSYTSAGYFKFLDYCKTPEKRELS